MIYSLVCRKQHNEKDIWELIEGYSLYTPYTSFYDINPEVLEKFGKQIKNILIYSKTKGKVVNSLEFKSVLKHAKLKTIL